MFFRICWLLFFLHYKCQKENMIMPKKISILEKSILFDGCPTAK